MEITQALAQKVGISEAEVGQIALILGEINETIVRQVVALMVEQDLNAESAAKSYQEGDRASAVHEQLDHSGATADGAQAAKGDAESGANPSQLALYTARQNVDLALSNQFGLLSQILIHADEATDIAADRIADQLEAVQDGRLLMGKVAKKLALRQAQKLELSAPVAAVNKFEPVIDLTNTDHRIVPVQYKGGEVQQFQLNQAE